MSRFLVSALVMGAAAMLVSSCSHCAPCDSKANTCASGLAICAASGESACLGSDGPDDADAP